MFQKDFKPALRFMVVSDVHYKDEPCVEEERMAKALQIAYRLSEESESYKKLDAVYAVGDFANSGTETQMRKFKATLDKYCKEETQYCLMMASHEYHGGGVEKAHELFKEIFEIPVDNHRVINGFHFISMTCSHACEFEDDKVEFAKKALKEAREADPKKPIFFFQHPHITDTVSGSIYWADEKFYTTFMDFPQVIDFSGHSHVPINDPRSIFQKHFTALGTGSLSYFELDEFDKYYGTVPPNKADCAQMLLVEADENGRVRIYPYDVLTDNFFPFVWEIDEPWNPESFKYTDARYKTDKAPYFPENTLLEVTDVNDKGFKLTFSQAKSDDEYVNDYKIVIKEKATGTIIKQSCLWSEYYFYNMPETLSITFDDLDSGKDYTVDIFAGSFWNTLSKPVSTVVTTK